MKGVVKPSCLLSRQILDDQWEATCRFNFPEFCFGLRVFCSGGPLEVSVEATFFFRYINTSVYVVERSSPLVVGVVFVELGNVLERADQSVAFELKPDDDRVVWEFRQYLLLQPRPFSRDVVPRVALDVTFVHCFLTFLCFFYYNMFFFLGCSHVVEKKNVLYERKKKRARSR